MRGRKVRRNRSLTEINHYDAEHDEINVRDVYEWQAESDEFLAVGDSNTLEEIRFDRGWSTDELEEQLLVRRAILAYLIDNGLNEYRQVAATLQAFINDPETIVELIANDDLAESLADLRSMESVLIDVDPETEALVPRPDPDEGTARRAREVLTHADERLFAPHHGSSGSLSAAISADGRGDGP